MRAITVSFIVLISVVNLYGREWTDSTGKAKVEAGFQGVEEDTVILKKQDGSVLRVPLERLSKKDQEYVEEITTAKAGRRIVEEIQQVFTASRKADTTAGQLLLEEEAAKNVSGHVVRASLRFPIQNVEPSGKDCRLALGCPDRLLDDNAYAVRLLNGSLTVRLSRTEILAIDQGSVCILRGTANVAYGDRSRLSEQLGWAGPTVVVSSLISNNAVRLHLVGCTYRIEDSKHREVARGEDDPAAANAEMYYTWKKLGGDKVSVTIHGVTGVPSGRLEAEVDTSRTARKKGVVVTTTVLFRVRGSSAEQVIIGRDDLSETDFSVAYVKGKIVSVDWRGRALPHGSKDKVTEDIKSNPRIQQRQPAIRSDPAGPPDLPRIPAALAVSVRDSTADGPRVRLTVRYNGDLNAPDWFRESYTLGCIITESIDTESRRQTRTVARIPDVSVPEALSSSLVEGKKDTGIRFTFALRGRGSAKETLRCVAVTTSYSWQNRLGGPDAKSKLDAHLFIDTEGLAELQQLLKRRKVN